MTNTFVGGQAAGRMTMTMTDVMADVRATMQIPEIQMPELQIPEIQIPERVRTRTRSKRASRNMVRTAIALIAAVFILVGLSAYAASIQHENNVLAQQNAYLQAEIDSLNSQIIEKTKVTRVEEIATKEYGMVYPTSANCIIIDESEESSTNLAASIRAEAYN